MKKKTKAELEEELTTLQKKLKDNEKLEQEIDSLRAQVEQSKEYEEELKALKRKIDREEEIEREVYEEYKERNAQKVKELQTRIIVLLISLLIVAIASPAVYNNITKKGICKIKEVEKNPSVKEETELDVYQKYLNTISKYDRFEITSDNALCTPNDSSQFSALALKDGILYSMNENRISDIVLKNVSDYVIASTTSSCENRYIIIVVDKGDKKDLYIAPYKNGEIDVSKLKLAVSNILEMGTCAGNSCTYYQNNYQEQSTFSPLDIIPEI